MWKHEGSDSVVVIAFLEPRREARPPKDGDLEFNGEILACFVLAILLNLEVFVRNNACASRCTSDAFLVLPWTLTARRWYSLALPTKRTDMRRPMAVLSTNRPNCLSCSDSDPEDDTRFGALRRHIA